MKIVSLIPYWSDYKNKIDNSMPRNLIKVGGRYLINYSIQMLDDVEEIDDVVIYTSSPDISQFIDADLEYTIQKRPDRLDDLNVSIEEIIKQFFLDTDADIVVLLHPNSPFLKSSTITECVKKVISGEYDSAFTGYEFHKFAWYKGKPLNYSLDEKVPYVNKIEPVIFEQSSLYVFSRTMFEKLERRIGNKPFIKMIDHFEGHDVNSKEDLDVAELIVNSGMYSKL